MRELIKTLSIIKYMLLVVFLMLEYVLFISNLTTSLIWQVIVLLSLIFITLFIKYIVEPDIKKNNNLNDEKK